MSPEHADFLRKHYTKRGQAWCAAALGLSVRQVQRRVQALKLKTHRRWTDADNDMLRWLWASRSLPVIAETMGRTEKAIYQQAKALELGLGCPRGMEYLTAAAKRTGYDTTSLQRILAASGVMLRRAHARPGAKPRGPSGVMGRPTWYVDPEAVDEAVAAWLATESVEAGARARGLTGYAVRSALLRRPEAATKPAPKLMWRVPSAVLDEVAQELHARRAA